MVYIKRFGQKAPQIPCRDILSHFTMKRMHVCRATNKYVVFINQTNCGDTLSQQTQPQALPKDFSLGTVNQTRQIDLMSTPLLL